MKKTINLLFIIAVVSFLALGFCRTVFFPKEINAYENRYANRMKAPTVASFADSTFQNSVEDSLSDQIPLAQKYKKIYNDVRSSYIVSLMKKTGGLDGGKYRKVGSLYLFGEDNIVYETLNFADYGSVLSARCEKYNEMFKKYPDVDFYLYYIEKDTDINFETNEKQNFSRYLLDNVALDDSKKGVFTVDSFDGFSPFFFKTDHHWNADGAYKGYVEILRMLLPDETPINKGEKREISNSFSGSKASGVGASAFSENFFAYSYDFSEMKITVNGLPANDYGNAEHYLSGGAGDVTYGSFFGNDDGEVIFDTQRPDRKNILILGESYDNAILKLLASSFNVTYSVDLRYYSAYMQKDFALSQYLKEHDIDTVLLVGNVDYYLAETFMPED